ncbi:quinone-dependent dihydroorotate dehydrogenase [Humibacter ginsenosidimutans]|uniref:Dihydroorotate dehydrogenase (quinone) n=1 Tax=Humibacter ginsenosidimutans TaxID=2599293 RepID=A0A5B8LYV0_9MICO|nr:quinone-dependent dihydroorotate dehydrogenase [Humibacter ginsenosidimutans]QDZ13688.1 quinone-dependent dihydroorotate dehydrogenase [Humibacter ginsenosidimutans]
MYRILFNLVFRRMDPERAHHLAFLAIRMIPMLGLRRLVRRFTQPRRDTSVTTLGLRFPTPFGVAAGFDKNATAILGLGSLGFGHVEVGTVTAIPQPGNPRPRLFRLIPDRAIVNRMGFNNEGATAAAARVAKVRRVRGRPIVGINIGKSRVVDVADAVADYRTSARAAAPVADYLVVNVSSPNTPGLRDLQALESLRPLLSAVREEVGAKPLLVKIAPDLADDDIVTIADLVIELGLDGIIATNTTISREGLFTDQQTVTAAGAGGLSGAPLAARSLDVLRLLRAHVPPELCVISVGGVETAQDVRDRLDAGATLVQGYTAFIYRGPFWARAINRGLDRLPASV